MAKIIFASGSRDIAELALNASEDQIKAAVEAGAKLLKDYTGNTGRSMGIWRTGDTLKSLTVKAAKRSADGWVCYVTYNGRNRKGNRNAEVAFINEYGKRGQPARPFNETAVSKAEEAVMQRMRDILNKDE